MARAALIAAHGLEEGQGDANFYQAKIVTARFYADHVLPRLPASPTAWFMRQMAFWPRLNPDFSEIKSKKGQPSGWPFLFRSGAAYLTVALARRSMMCCSTFCCCSFWVSCAFTSSKDGAFRGRTSSSMITW